MMLPKALPEKPSVSVVIPTRKRPEMLQRALASVFAQEGAGGLFDMEVLVIDDIGLPTTHDVMRQFPSVKYILLPHEVTASGARNAGIKAASGRYIAFLDDDDEYLPHKLKTQIPVLAARPEIGVLYGQIQVYEEGKLTSLPGRRRPRQDMCSRGSSRSPTISFTPTRCLFAANCSTRPDISVRAS